MSNTNAPFGLRPTMRTLVGAAGSIIPCHKLVGYGTALFIHDAVTHAAAGTKNTVAVDAAITPGTTPVAGVNLIYGAASAATDHAMVDAAHGIFLTQGDGTGATFLVAASLSKNANLALTAGNTATKMSKHELSETSLNTTNTLDLRVRGLFQDPSNALGQYAKVFVTFNNLVDANQIAGI
ncbi:MAG: hypothetical protein LAP40_16920 [Acidobacteriia bacterium]|nr:hypothetical protein [Terriglobia bacterium]